MQQKLLTQHCQRLPTLQSKKKTKKKTRRTEGGQKEKLKEGPMNKIKFVSIQDCIGTMSFCGRALAE